MRGKSLIKWVLLGFVSNGCYCIKHSVMEKMEKQPNSWVMFAFNTEHIIFQSDDQWLSHSPHSWLRQMSLCHVISHSMATIYGSDFIHYPIDRRQNPRKNLITTTTDLCWDEWIVFWMGRNLLFDTALYFGTLSKTWGHFHSLLSSRPVGGCYWYKWSETSRPRAHYLILVTFVY